MPTFIVGFARSGTTLCQRVVAERFALPTVPETHYFECLPEHSPEGDRLTRRQAQGLLSSLSPYLPLKQGEREALLPARGTPVRALFMSLLEALLPATTASAQALQDGQWLEKTPGHVWHMERILKLFPKARFIAMVRSPFTALASRRELAEPGKGWGETWRPIEDYARDWAWTQQHIWQFGQAHPGALLMVRLEDLSLQPELELARIGAFLHRAPRRSRRLGQSRLLMPFETWKRGALGEVDPAVAQRQGRSGLSPFERWRLSQILAPQLAALGYTEEAPEPPLDELHRQLLASVDWFRPPLPAVPQEGVALPSLTPAS
ncbi:MAG: sulfotransferase [Ideonella sp.]|nr:sulfotransferase [Ideonella sp.]